MPQNLKYRMKCLTKRQNSNKSSNSRRLCSGARFRESMDKTGRRLDKMVVAALGSPVRRNQLVSECEF